MGMLHGAWLVPAIIGKIGLAIALLGTASSTVFLGMVLAATWQYRRSAKLASSEHAVADSALPPVSLLKPVHGMEARLEENIESFFLQDYPQYEILFAADEEDDEALPLVREICERYPHVPSRVLVTGNPPWPNPVAYGFHCMAEVAAHDILVTSDSDVAVSPRYLREVVPPLLNPKVGMVTCLYRGKNAGGFWSALSAIGMSVEMTAGVLVANMLEGMKFGLGPTIAVRKDSLAIIGGYKALGEYYANDFMIGNLIDKAGFKVVLSEHVIDHVVPPMSFAAMWSNQMRWAKSTRYSRPMGHLGSGFIFAMPYGILGFVSALLLGHPVMAASLLWLALLNRVVEGWVVGWGVVGDSQAMNAPWLYPIRDLLGFIVWCGSYLGTRSVWGDRHYKLLEEGRIIRE
jgi:ceramide glucosyltransferase